MLSSWTLNPCHMLVADGAAQMVQANLYFHLIVDAALVNEGTIISPHSQITSIVHHFPEI